MLLPAGAPYGPKSIKPGGACVQSDGRADRHFLLGHTQNARKRKVLTKHRPAPPSAPVEAVRVRHSTSPAALARVPCPADAHASARAREVIVMAAMSQQSSHEEKFRVYNDALLHAATCRDPQCTQEQNRCRKVKASIDHFVRCYGPRRKISPIESCAACGKIWQLLCYHAKTCPTPPSGHCVVSQCDYLREKIARKQARDQSELQQARDSLKSKLEEWPVQRRIAQVEADRLQVLQIIAEIRAQKAARQQPQMMSIG